MFFEGEKLKQIRVACLVDCASYFYEMRDFEAAVEYCRKALLLNPDDYYANVGLACALIANKSFEESLASFEKAISIRKLDRRTLPWLFAVYEGLGKEDLARRVLEEMVQYVGNNEAAAHDGLAYIYFMMNLFTEAERHSKKALEISPDKGTLHYNLGKIYFAQGNTREAKVEFQRAVELTHDKKEKRIVGYANRYLTLIDRKEMKKVL